MTIYLEHFGLTEAPFKITPHTEFFFAGANRGETLEGLIYAITSGEGMVKVTGEVGAGKTMLCRVLMERLPNTVETIYLAVPSLSRDEMLAVITGDLGLETHGVSTTKLVRALQEKLIAIHAEGRQVVALIDEAHAMPLETLEEIRLLSNLETSHDKLMQIVLFGQPELDQHLSLPHMRQLKERITHSFQLQPLPANDIKDYVNFRLRAAGYKGPDLFSADALKLIAEASEGLTRRINIYADKTMLAAYAAGTHTITPDHVRAAITDTQIVLPNVSVNPLEYGADDAAKSTIGHNGGLHSLVLASVLLIGLIIGFGAGRMTALDRTPTAAAAANTTMAAAPTSAVAAAPVAVPPADTTPRVSQPVRAPVAAPSLAVIAPPTGIASIQTPVSAGLSRLNWLGTRMNADVSRLNALTGTPSAIQLMTADSRESLAIENFLRAASRELNSDRIMLVPSASTGDTANPRVSVLFGPFANRAAATQSLAKLSAAVSQYSPYVRSIKSIREDLQPVVLPTTVGSTISPAAKL
jgi:MSHA biogenesis protein MshM